VSDLLVSFHWEAGISVLRGFVPRLRKDPLWRDFLFFSPPFAVVGERGVCIGHCDVSLQCSLFPFFSFSRFYSFHSIAISLRSSGPVSRHPFEPGPLARSVRRQPSPVFFYLLCAPSEVNSPAFGRHLGNLPCILGISPSLRSWRDCADFLSAETELLNEFILSSHGVLLLGQLGVPFFLPCPSRGFLCPSFKQRLGRIVRGDSVRYLCSFCRVFPFANSFICLSLFSTPKQGSRFVMRIRPL